MQPCKKGDREFASEMMKFLSGAPTCKLWECYLGSLNHTKPGAPCPRRQLEYSSLLDNWPAPEKSPSVTTICLFGKAVVLVTLWPFIYQLICFKSFSPIVVSSVYLSYGGYLREILFPSFYFQPICIIKSKGYR